MKAILKYRNHLSIITSRNQCKNRNSFSFIKVEKKINENLILNQDLNKVSQSSDIPLKTVKENTDILNDCLCNSFKISIKSTNFPKNLKLAGTTPLHKKGKKYIKGKHKAFFLNYQKYLKSVSLHKCPDFLTIYFRNISAVSERTLVGSSVFSNTSKVEKIC